MKQNKNIIEEQTRKTVDAQTRDRLYPLNGQEVERGMMARNWEKIGLRVIGSPRVADRKFKPKKSQSAIVTANLSFFFACDFFIVRNKSHKNVSPLAATGAAGPPSPRS